jgi:hypothetical protein
MSETLSTADVARLLRHAEPESAAATEMVRRLVRRGMPCVACVRPMLFFRDQVVAWLRSQAEGESAPAPSPAPARARGRAKLARTGGESALARRVAELRAQR